MRKLYLISCAIVLCMGAIAQEFETIYTSVGNIYKGYISEQIPGKTVAIYATDATLSLGNSDIANFRDEYRRVENLSFIAKEYFKGGEEYVKLCSFEYKGNSIDDALLLKQTSDSLFVRVFTPTTYHLAWKDIVKVEKTISSDIYNDILSVIVLKDGTEYRGKLLNQVLGESITIEDQDGFPFTVLMSNISSFTSDISRTENLFKQIPLLDVIVLKDDSMVTGFITSRVMGKYISIYSKEQQDELVVELAKIARYRKIENPDYAK